MQWLKPGIIIYHFWYYTDAWSNVPNDCKWLFSGNAIINVFIKIIHNVWEYKLCEFSYKRFIDQSRLVIKVLYAWHEEY